jgi:hypothetical protein
MIVLICAPGATMLPPLTRCAVHVHDLAAAAGAHYVATQKALQADHYQHWDHDPFSTEVWLQRSLAHRQHPWIVSSHLTADVIFVAANLSLMCISGKAEISRKMWLDGMKRLLGLMQLQGNGSVAAPMVVASYQYKQGCIGQKYSPPWPLEANLKPHMVLVDQILHSSHAALGQMHSSLRATVSSPLRQQPFPIITPFAISSPHWLTSGRVSPHTPWVRRKLIFFGGHVPKLYINPLRYRLWRQLRRDPRATTMSRTIGCTVAAYVTCTRNREWPTDDGNVSFFHSHCYANCPSLLRPAAAAAAAGRKSDAHDTERGAASWSASRSDSSAVRARKQRGGIDSCIGKYERCTGKGPCVEISTRLAAFMLRQQCKRYREVDFAAEAEDMQRDVMRSGTREQFLSEAAGHRFCLIAQGDPGNTAKIVETIALGAAGGCIPLFVLFKVREPRLPVATDFVRDYPYLRWLDYCRVAYFVTWHAAVHNMSSVLRWLEDVTSEEAEAKMEALRAVRPAFVFRSKSSVERPSAAEYVLSEVCERTRALQRQAQLAAGVGGNNGGLTSLAGGVHERCTFA